MYAYYSSKSLVYRFGTLNIPKKLKRIFKKIGKT